MIDNRLKSVKFSILICFILIVSRLFYLQIISYRFYQKKLINQNTKTNEIYPLRGRILDSLLSPLALNQTKYQISLYKPEITSSPDSINATISSIRSNLDQKITDQLSNFWNNKSQKWLTLGDLFLESEIFNISHAGLIVSPINDRIYPESNLGKTFLGNLTLDPASGLTTSSGLEQYFQKQLSGKIGYSWETKDALGQVNLSKANWTVPSLNGRDIVISINRPVQYHTEKILIGGVNKYQADSGSIIIMSPQSGAILAMAVYSASSSATLNPVISSLYEPGSIFKPLVVAIGLDSHRLQPNYICPSCQKPHQIGQYTISNWDNSFHPNSSLADIIKNSDNIGMSYIIEDIGQDIFLKYFHQLNLDKKTGIDLPLEVKPPQKTFWPAIDLATASFGQGFAISQIQMITAFNSLANNGKLVRPHFLLKYLENQTSIFPPTEEPVQIFNQTSMKTIIDILRYSVNNGVVARFKPTNLDVCAKSGTSEVAVQGGYSDSATIASYIGFSPCQQPKFTMLVTINNPRSSPWGSSTAAPIWYDLAAFISPLL